MLMAIAVIDAKQKETMFTSVIYCSSARHFVAKSSKKRGGKSLMYMLVLAAALSMTGAGVKQ